MRNLILGTLLAIVSLTFSCTSDSPIGSPPLIGPPDIDKSPRADADAELAALMLSGSLAAPDSLYERIHHDLEMIREKLADSIPAVNIAFRTPWVTGGMIAHFELTFLNDTSTNHYRQFDSLNTLLRHDTTTRFIFSSFYTMRFEGRLHPVRLIELYQVVPGIVSLETNGYIGDGPDFYILPDGDTYRYFFREAWGDCPSGCINSKFYYVTVESGNVDYIGSYPRDSQDTTGLPNWVDSVGIARSRKYDQAQMNWYADHVDTLSAYFPNAVGNRWDYHLFDRLGQKSDTLTVNIVGNTTFADSMEAAVWVYNYAVQQIVDTQYVMVRDSHVLVYRDKPFDMGPLEPDLDFVIPLKIGQSWAGNVSTTYLVEGTDDLFLRSSRFLTFRISRNTDTQGTEYLWFYPHIGLVRHDSTAFGNTLQLRRNGIELFSHRLLPEIVSQ